MTIHNRVEGCSFVEQPTSHRTVRSGLVHGSSPVYTFTDM